MKAVNKMMAVSLPKAWSGRWFIWPATGVVVVSLGSLAFAQTPKPETVLASPKSSVATIQEDDRYRIARVMWWISGSSIARICHARLSGLRATE